jgi:hypothetical protein
MSTKFKIYDTIEAIRADRKAGHKDWFDKMNDRFDEAYSDECKPIIDVLQKLNCDEKQDRDVFEYSYKDTEGVSHVLFKFDLREFNLEYPFLTDIMPTDEEVKSVNNGKLPKCFDNPLMSVAQAYVYLIMHILNDRNERACSLARCIYFYCLYLSKGKSVIK